MLSNKTIIVTGAASGIGAESAKLLASRGAKIITMDLKKPDIAYDQYIQIDLADIESIKNAVLQIDEPIDILCNIAGVPPTAGEEVTLKVNFLGLRAFTTLIEPKIKDQGSIINMASLAGFEWDQSIDATKEFMKMDLSDDLSEFIAKFEIKDARAYFFSKEVLRVWTMLKSISLAGRGIKVNTLSPGPVDTPILQDFIISLGKRAEDDLKKNRAGSAAEIAGAVAFLCSDDSRWLNGANIPTDGGAMAAALVEKYGLNT